MVYYIKGTYPYVTLMLILSEETFILISAYRTQLTKAKIKQIIRTKNEQQDTAVSRNSNVSK